MRVYLNIGSNQGDRKAIIGRAVALIARELSPCRMRLSSWYDSEPWGYDSTEPYVNLGVLADCPDRDPLRLLDAIQAIEQALAPDSPHRNPDGTYRDRRIDIDIIDIDGISLSTPRLTLPHPRAAGRDFVMVPWRELIGAGDS